MAFSMSTLINNILINSIIISLFLLFLKSRTLSRHISVSTILLVSIVIILRYLFPFEFFFTRSIYIESIYPSIIRLLRYPLFNLGFGKIYLYYILLTIWLLGSIICLIRLVIEHHRGINSIKRLPNIHDPQIIRLVNKINCTFKKPVRFELKVSEYSNTPIISGIVRPVIVLPQTNYDTTELEYILMHEMYHFYRKHLHIKIVSEFITAIYFWNPMIYILKNQLYKSLELNADFEVTKSLNALQKIAYMQCIVKTAKKEYKNYVDSSFTIAFSMLQRSDITQRVQAIFMADTETIKGKKHNTVISFAIIILTLLPFFFIIEPHFINETDKAISFELNYETAYLIPNGDGTYELYDGQNFIATVGSRFDPKIKIKEENKND